MGVRTGRISLGALALALAAPAFAQQAAEAPAPEAAPPAATPPAPTGDVNEIVVTAQFREQRLQDTPLAITAVNSAMLAARGQTSIYEVAAQAPNVTLAPQQQNNGSGLVAFIRGVGQTDFNFALEPGVGIYVDDVYISTLTGSLLDLMDLDRVEVLRGPQGTLAGKNSIGGAIKLFSAKPDGNGRGSLQVTYGSYNRVEARGVADFKVMDNLFARVAAVTKHQDGYVTRLDYNATHPGTIVPTNNAGDGDKLGTLGGVSYSAIRGSLRWVPDDKLEVNVSGDYTHDSSEAGASVLLYANAPDTNGNGLPNATVDGVGVVIPYDCRFVPYGKNSCDTITGHNRKYISYATFQDSTPATSQAPFKPIAISPIQHLNQWGVQGTIDYKLSEDFALKLISGYRSYNSSWAQDEDGSPLASQELLQTLKHWQWQEELRLNGSILDNKLDFTVGGFYFKQGGTLHARVDLNYAGIDFIHGPDTTPSKSEAVFLNTIYHFTDRLNLSAGVRYSHDTKTYTYYRRNPDGTIPNAPCAFFLGAPTAGPTGIGNAPNCLLVGLFGISDGFKGNRTDWRVALDYRFSDALMAYAQVSTGYKGGGVNPRPFFGPSSGANNQLKAFSPETLTTYEVGFKSDFFDRKLRFNAAAFYNDYNNIILTLTACPASPCLQPNNIGKAHVKGVEFETTIKPFLGVTLDGSLSYLDFQYVKFNATPALLGGLTLDMITPYTPRWKWDAGAQYDFAAFNGTITARLDGSYQSHIYTEAINDPLYNRINGHFTANGRLTYATADKDWQISLEVRNLTNKYYYLTLFDQHQASSSTTVSGQPSMPRTWAVTVKKTF